MSDLQGSTEVRAPIVRKNDGNPEAKEKKLPFYQKLSFGTGHILQALAIALWFPYSVAFFTKVLQLPPASVGTIVLVGQVSGAVFTQFLGVWSDRIPFRTWRRKALHLLGMVSGAGSFFFLWHECVNCYNAPASYQVVYFSAFAVMFQFSWACVQIAQLSLIPELTNDRSVKVELNSLRYLFTMVSFLTIFVVIWVLLQKLYDGGSTADLNPSDKNVFWIAALVVTGVGLLISFPFQFLVHENPHANPPRLEWYKWFMMLRFWLVLFVFMFTRILQFFPFFYLPLYLLNTLHMDKASIAKAPLVLYIFCIIATLFTKRFNKLIGTKMTYFFGIVIFWGSLLWFWAKEPAGDQQSHFEWPRDSIYGAAVLLGLGSATCIVIALSSIANLVGKYTGSSSFVAGCMLCGDRVINGVLVKIVQQFHPDLAAGREVLGNFYRDVLVYTTLSASIAGLLTVAILKLQDIYQLKRMKLLADCDRASPFQAGILPIGPSAHQSYLDREASTSSWDAVTLERARVSETSMTSSTQS